MKISELIEKLDAIKATHGDLEAMIDAGSWDSSHRVINGASPRIPDEFHCEFNGQTVASIWN